MNKVKNIGKSFMICMSMYSIIPMPLVNWEEKSMKYILSFLPFIGGIIGVCMMGMDVLLHEFTNSFHAVMLLIFPIIISGGIHIDGLIDTCDAFFSYGDKEKKLEILKDPRTGAFGVLGAIIYFLILYGIYVQILENQTSWYVVFPWIFIISRSVGALCMIHMPNARKGGLGATFSDASEYKVVIMTLNIWLIISVSALWLIDPRICVLFIAIVLLFLMTILPMYRKKFGGITGDLTGCVISLLELLLPLGMAIGGALL